MPAMSRRKIIVSLSRPSTSTWTMLGRNSAQPASTATVGVTGPKAASPA